jgi:hypothetical protein
MAIQTINIGNQVNDGLGDDLRTAFEKVNANFADISSTVFTTASNVGDTGTGVFKQKVGANLEFKKLVSGTKIFIDEAPSSIIINSTAADAFTRIDTNAGTVNAASFQQITVQGGDDIDVTALGSVITVNNVIPVTNILTTYDFGPITGAFTNTTQLALAFANIDFGTITQPSTVTLDCGGII